MPLPASLLLPPSLLLLPPSLLLLFPPSLSLLTLPSPPPGVPESSPFMLASSIPPSLTLAGGLSSQAANRAAYTRSASDQRPISSSIPRVRASGEKDMHRSEYARDALRFSVSQ